MLGIVRAMRKNIRDAIISERIAANKRRIGLQRMKTGWLFGKGLDMSSL